LKVLLQKLVESQSSWPQIVTANIIRFVNGFSVEG